MAKKPTFGLIKDWLEEELNQVDDSSEKIKDFSLVMAAFFNILGLVRITRTEESGITFFSLGLLVLILGAFKPKYLGSIYKYWMMLALVMNWLVTNLILFIVFTMVLVPIGSILKMRGHQFLDTSFDKSKKSYWLSKKKFVTTKKRYLKQF